MVGANSLQRPAETSQLDGLIAQAVYQRGCSQMEVTRYLQLHYSTVSRLIKSVAKEQRLKI